MVIWQIILHIIELNALTSMFSDSIFTNPALSDSTPSTPRFSLPKFSPSKSSRPKPSGPKSRLVIYSVDVLIPNLYSKPYDKIYPVLTAQLQAIAEEVAVLFNTSTEAMKRKVGIRFKLKFLGQKDSFVNKEVNTSVCGSPDGQKVRNLLDKINQHYVGTRTIALLPCPSIVYKPLADMMNLSSCVFTSSYNTQCNTRAIIPFSETPVHLMKTFGPALLEMLKPPKGSKVSVLEKGGGNAGITRQLAIDEDTVKGILNDACFGRE